jgi:hypothetical protein
MLLAVMAVPAMATEVSKPASVTVTEVISFTVTDAGTAGINFGSLAQGTTNGPEVNQTDSVGAVTLVVAAETNVNCNVQIKASGDFSDSTHTIALSNAKWDTDNGVDGATAMSTTYATIGTSTAGTAYSQDVWHWLTIPGAQVAGTYTTTYYYQAVKA